MPCISFETVPVKPGFTLNDMNDATKTVSAQPGIQKVFIGLQSDDPERLHIFLNWNSVEDHHRFAASEVYGPFVARLSPLLAGPMDIFHASLEPSSKVDDILGAPSASALTFYFGDNGVPVRWLDDLALFGKEVIEQAEGCLGTVIGRIDEKLGLDGHQREAVQMVVGWETPGKALRLKGDQEYVQRKAALVAQTILLRAFDVSMRVEGKASKVDEVL